LVAPANRTIRTVSITFSGAMPCIFALLAIA
jgi:hypothetical protein